MRQYVCLMALGTYATFANAFTDIASSVLPVAQGMMQNQQAGQAAQQQQAQAMAQIQVEQNQASQALTQAQSAEMANMAAQEKKGYPILDPFARGTYWAMRDTQFKTSMAIAAKRSELETKASKEAIDREFQATQQMITAVGGLMKTAGEQVQKLGQTNASAAASARTSAAVAAGLESKEIQCDDNGKNCFRSVNKPEGGECPTGTRPAGTQCVSSLTAAEQAEIDRRNAATAQQSAIAAPPNCAYVPGQIHKFTCTGGGTTEMSREEAVAFGTRRTQVQKNLSTEIQSLSATLVALPANHPSRKGLEDHLKNLTAANNSFDTRDLGEVELLVTNASTFRDVSTRVAASVAAGPQTR